MEPHNKVKIFFGDKEFKPTFGRIINGKSFDVQDVTAMKIIADEVIVERNKMGINPTARLYR
jgi:hypothetical protein